LICIVFALSAPLVFGGFAVNAQVDQQAGSVSEIYQNIKDGVVVITDMQPQTSLLGTSYSLVQGSGFVYGLNGQMVVITNYHVIAQGVNISVTFSDGNGYSASVLGVDPYSDLAVLSTTAPETEYHPLTIVSSSTLNVGDFVAALGTPFGLSGSLTVGIVSQLGRTITEETTGNYPIANVIQTDAPINPGNSGGPLVDSQGQVVGINTAGISGSTGVGFAIPSDTILREIDTLVTTGTYTQHSYLGITSVDMNYDIASQTGVSITYGVLIQDVTAGSAAANAGIQGGDRQQTIDGAQILVGGDIIIALNGTKIITMDQFSAYLAQNTLPNQNITITVLREDEEVNLVATLGTRPAPSGFTPPTPQPTVSPAVPEFIVPALAVIASAITCVVVFLRLRSQELRRR
jgi:S1-C subfamily serine protease